MDLVEPTKWQGWPAAVLMVVIAIPEAKSILATSKANCNLESA